MDTNVIEAPESAKPGSLSEIKRKTKFTGTVIKTTIAGAIVDIGLDTPGVVHISQLQQEHTNRVEDVVKVGQTVDVWVKRVDPKKNRIDLTMIEPLALEWRELTKGMVVKGKVTRLEKFGAFIEIGAERPGLVHISEMTHEYIKTPGDVVKEGDDVEVQVLEVNRRKKQIKLSMKALEEKPVKEVKPTRQAKEKEKEAPAEEGEKEPPVPTAMELAMRQAMERSNTKIIIPKGKGKRKPQSSSNEMEQIFSRTLQNKVRTGK
ncbi:MAG: S1 RNA-binding domain-containing protein [Anaerolineaceae bacterium]